MYSTCTFAKMEDEDTISWLLSEEPDLELVPLTPWDGASSGFDGMPGYPPVPPIRSKEKAISLPCFGKNVRMVPAMREHHTRLDPAKFRRRCAVWKRKVISASGRQCSRVLLTEAV